MCWPCRHLKHPICHLQCSCKVLCAVCRKTLASILANLVCRYEKPTAIQAQALPAALSGRDVLVGIPASYCSRTGLNAHQDLLFSLFAALVVTDSHYMVHATSECFTLTQHNWHCEACNCHSSFLCCASAITLSFAFCRALPKQGQAKQLLLCSPCWCTSWTRLKWRREQAQLA